MTIRKKVAGVGVAAVLGACASAPKPPPPKPAVDASSPAPATSDIRIGHPRDGVFRDAGTYVLIRRKDDAWETVLVDSGRSNREWFTDPKKRKASEGELLFISRGLKYVSVEFAPIDVKDSDDGKEGRYVCFHVDQGKRNTKDFYPNACNSDLTSSVDVLKNTATQVAVAAITLGITALAANTRKGVDPTKVVAAMDAAGVIPRVKQYRYEQEFAAARTSRALQEFIERYRNDDPEGLVANAQTALPAQIETERLAAEQVAREQAQATEKRRREAEFAEQARIQRTELLRTRTAQFRQSLQPGDQSHCGLVVEVRKPLVKLQTMIGEYWMRVDQVYAAGDHDCRFVNGEYRD